MVAKKLLFPLSTSESPNTKNALGLASAPNTMIPITRTKLRMKLEKVVILKGTFWMWVGELTLNVEVVVLGYG